MSHQHTHTRSASSTTSPISPGDSLLSALAAAPTESSNVAELFQKMKESIGPLEDALDALGQRMVENIRVGGGRSIEQHIGSIRTYMEKQSRKQEFEITGIQDLLQEVLENDVIEHLTELIESGVLSNIDSLVAEKVAEELPRYIPQDLQDEVRQHQKELEAIEKALYNSESKRANSTLRSHRLNDRVHSLFNVQGVISPDFPQTLHGIFTLSDEKTILLLQEYDLGMPSESRERNINCLMQGWGIQYQLVSTGAGAPIPCRTTSTANSG